MLRHPSVVAAMNFLYVLIGAIFFTLLIGLNYEHYGWLQNMNEFKMALWIISVLLSVWLTTFISYSIRPWLLLLYLIAALILVQYPLIRKKRIIEVSPVETKKD